LRRIDADLGQPARLQNFSIVSVEPVATSPSPANERNTMPASQLKLPMM
jgi:hypothetical protein